MKTAAFTTQEGLRFHVGPNAEHMASTSIRDMSTNQLGRVQVPEGELPNIRATSCHSLTLMCVMSRVLRMHLL